MADFITQQLTDLLQQIDVYSTQNFPEIRGYALKVINYFSNNPLVATLVLFSVIKEIYDYFKRKSPSRRKGSKVIEITSKEHYNELVKSAKESGVLVIIDFYATWYENI